MRVPQFILQPLASVLIWALETGRLAPHKYGDIRSADGELYMERGWLVKPGWWSLGYGARVHKTVRSDADRAFHDHPWANASVILRGSYREEVPALEDRPIFLLSTGEEMVHTFRRDPGDVVTRPAGARHRLIIRPGSVCYSLFLMGPWRQVWGFHTKSGKVEWRTYLGLPPKGPDEKH